MLKTEIKTTKATSEAGQESALTVPINFHVTKLHNADKKLHAYCIVMQPIIRTKADPK